jgi:hypothetical protein
LAAITSRVQEARPFRPFSNMVRVLTPVSSASALAHDPEKCERSSDKIMRKIKDVERDPFR